MIAAVIGLGTPTFADPLKFDPAWLGQSFTAVIDQTNAPWRANPPLLGRADPWIAEHYSSWAGLAFDAHLQGERGVVDALILYNVRDIAKDACEADYISLLAALEAAYGTFHWDRNEPDDEIIHVGVNSESLLYHGHDHSAAEDATGGFVGRAQTIWRYGEHASLIDVHGDYADDACSLIVAYSRAG